MTSSSSSATSPPKVLFFKRTRKGRSCIKRCWIKRSARAVSILGLCPVQKIQDFSVPSNLFIRETKAGETIDFLKMDFFPSNEFGTCSNSSNVFHGQSSLMKGLNVGNSIPSSKSITGTTKSLAACKNHSEAERRRRKRINGHLSTLRTLLPNTIKTDKASLLAEVVRRVKELKHTTAELAADSMNTNTDKCSYNIVPSETDELKLYYCDQHFGTIEATICCDDRPELMQRLTRALNSVQAKVVRAEMATVGGRTKMVLWVQSSSIDRNEGNLTVIRRALKLVVDGAALLPGSTDFVGLEQFGARAS